LSKAESLDCGCLPLLLRLCLAGHRLVLLRENSLPCGANQWGSRARLALYVVGAPKLVKQNVKRASAGSAFAPPRKKRPARGKRAWGKEETWEWGRSTSSSSSLFSSLPSVYSPPVWKIRVRAMANLLRPGASATPYVVVRGQLVKRNLQFLGGFRLPPGPRPRDPAPSGAGGWRRPAGGNDNICSLSLEPAPGASPAASAGNTASWSRPLLRASSRGVT